MPPVITIENLGICFKLFHRPNMPKKELVKAYVRDLASRVFMRNASLPDDELFWALREVTLSIGKGEAIGIIGVNGSGKSTLMKTIAGIFTPDEGTVTVTGTVGALIELGAGFHPELNGRENIYLNGSILGMKRREIDRIYDDIVEFSEIEEFMETPIKNYSSGMKVRLGFSIAAHLKPDILLIDEVLAVGDMAFRMKCLDKMTEFKKQGVTILFVSHDLLTVRSFCEKVILIHHGKVLDFGPSLDVTNRYYKMVIDNTRSVKKGASPPPTLNQSGRPAGFRDASHPFFHSPDFHEKASFQRIQNGKATFANIRLMDEQEREVHQVEYEQCLILRMAVEVHEDIPLLAFGYHIRDKNGVDVIYSDSRIEDTTLTHVKRGQFFLIDWAFNLSLKQGGYNILCVLSEINEHNDADVTFCDLIPVACQFEAYPSIRGPLFGMVHIENKVTITPVE